MEWTKRLTQLNDILSDLVPRQEGIETFVTAAGLKLSMINLHGNALEMWNSVIDEARKQYKVDNLINAVLVKYPDNPFLKSALDPTEIDYSLSPKLDEISKWNGIDAETLEVLTFDKNTLLSINFLERGIISSHAVAKVEIRSKTSICVGTGFLFKIHGNEDLLFMTNHHVISDKNEISKTKIIFDYEEDVNGNLKSTKSFQIDKYGPWFSSPVNELDVTIFKLVDSGNLNDYGYLILDKIQIQKKDFVNIIQHPAGQPKKISLYHNIVTNITDSHVQYLTDTMGGSSGSPVFNSDWNVVAIHHSGGKVTDSLQFGTEYRNEGVIINKIIDFIKNSIQN